MAKSILQSDKKCYVTGDTYSLHKHHVFGGGWRKLSEKWGCWVWLRSDYHNASNHGVHSDHDLDMRIKKDAQKCFEELYGHATFMQVFGKNYL